jgi:hypothetical protein
MSLLVSGVCSGDLSSCIGGDLDIPWDTLNGLFWFGRSYFGFVPESIFREV